jgi:N-acetyl-alpha-D-glucosaminyl L-malate synthase BshA
LRKDTLRLFNITKDIKVIYNFIDFEKYPEIDSEECQRHTIADKNERIITHVSNLRPVKRVADVITIFYKIQKEIPSKLLVVGEGPDRESIEHQAKNLGIFDKILFLGNSHEVNKLLCYSDLFLLPSETESFGLAALEAMAARTPVISTNSGGLPEVNVQGVTGFLSNVGDTDDMAKNGIYILEDLDRLQQFKQNALAQAKKFSLDHVLPAYLEVYREVLVNCC